MEAISYKLAFEAQLPNYEEYVVKELESNASGDFRCTSSATAPAPES